MHWPKSLSFGCVLVLALVVAATAATAAEADKVADPVAISTALQNSGSARVIVTFTLEAYDNLHSKAVASKKAAANAGALARPALQATALQAEEALSAAIRTGVRTALASVSAGSVTPEHVFSTIPAALLTVDSAGLHALEDSDQVAYIEYDKVIPLPKPVGKRTEADSPASDYGTSLIGADQAWARGYTGEGWYVAIVDTGIRRTHEYFEGKDIVEACFTSRTEDNPDTTLCPNGEDSQTGAGAAAFRGDASEDGYDHGGHVAGIAVGHKADDSRNGVAKGADIIAVNVFANGYTSPLGTPVTSTTFADILRALEYVYSLQDSYNIAALNMSLGGDVYESTCDNASSSLTSVINNLRDVNIATIVSAGNGSHCNAICIPACISTAIGVGASDSSDVKADFSDWQADMVPLFAPGVDITSATNGSDTSYQAWDGTSMAAPFVAGAWAVIRQKSPNASVASVLNALQITAAHVTFTTCGNPTDVYRRISVIGALNEFSSPTNQADILWHNTATGRNAAWFLSGADYVGFTMLYPTTTTLVWSMVGTGDFNSDGQTDILWHSQNGKTALWHMDGCELSNWAMLEDTSEAWSPVGVGDWNQDGHPDIYWLNAQNRRTAVWYMNDAELLEFVYPEETQDAPWTIAGAADFNADGMPDLLWRNPETGANQIWLMDGIARSESVDIQAADSPWYVVGTGDFNDDGNPDILWRRSETGANCIWYMDGTTYTSFEMTDSISSPWEAQSVGVFH